MPWIPQDMPGMTQALICFPMDHMRASFYLKSTQFYLLPKVQWKLVPDGWKVIRCFAKGISYQSSPPSALHMLQSTKVQFSTQKKTKKGTGQRGSGGSKFSFAFTKHDIFSSFLTLCGSWVLRSLTRFHILTFCIIWEHEGGRGWEGALACGIPWEGLITLSSS